MDQGNIVCPVCSLYLREGITLKTHLGTHPKEKVIEALLKATDGTGNSQPAVQHSPVQACLPLANSSPGSMYVSPGNQYVNPQTQLTAVAYQHVMTSTGSAIVPQYIQVPTIVAPNNGFPMLQQQSFGYVPPQALYNSMYNPYMQQPYPQGQSLHQPPVITSVPMTDVERGDLNVAPTMSETQCSIATNTGAEEMELSDCKSEVSMSPPPPLRKPAKQAGRFFKPVNKPSKASCSVPNSVSVVTVSKMSSKTSVITTAKPRMRVPPVESAYSSFSSSSSLCSSPAAISPPPLTYNAMIQAQGRSISCSPPPLPPLTPAPVLTDPNLVKNEEQISDPRSSSPVITTDEQIFSIKKVTEYLNQQQNCKSVNSVIVESNITTIRSVDSCETVSQCNTRVKLSDDRDKVPDMETDMKDYVLSSLSNIVGEVVPKCDVLDNTELEEPINYDTAEEYFHKEDILEDEKKSELLDDYEDDEKEEDDEKQDIPEQINSANIDRNCDGSDIFIQEENIPFSDELLSTKLSTSIKDAPNYSDEYITSDIERVHYSEDIDPLAADIPKYTDLQPAAYLSLQPTPVDTKSLTLSNLMQIGGIQIYFTNNPSSSLSITKKCKAQDEVHSSHNYFSAEPPEVKSSVIQMAAATDSSTLCHKTQENLSPLTLNIQADESMPARGELSEQESLGADNSNWGMFHAEEARDWKPNVSGLIAQPASSKRFKCSLCENTFSCPKERRVHKNTVHLDQVPVKTANLDKNPVKKTKSFKCLYCDKVYTCFRERRVHIMGQHTDEEKTRKMWLAEKIKNENAGAVVDGMATGAVSQVKDETDTKPSSILLPGAIPSKRCQKCSDIIPVKKLKMHLREVHGEVKYQCTTCSACFDEETEYNLHLKVHPLVCNECGKTFYRKVNLNLHMKRHLKVKPFECTLCPKSFITRQKLEEHTNSHSGNRPIKCNLCERSFSRHSNLIQHRNMHHMNVRRKMKDYVCRCGEVFHSLRKLEWHKEVHEAKPKTCPFCAQKFIHSASVTRHVRRAHMPDYLPGDNREYENVQCPICDRVYVRSSLIVHMRVHNGEKPFMCQICSKRFSTKWNLELHNWTHQSRSNMPFKCATCKSAFFRESDYTAHINSHKNFKPFTCNICGQKFIRKYNCLRHQEEHRKAKKFSCTVAGCDKSFHRSYYLKDHMKIHTGVRPHTCHICGKASSTKSNHNKHVRIHDTREPVNTEN